MIGIFTGLVWALLTPSAALAIGHSDYSDDTSDSYTASASISWAVFVGIVSVIVFIVIFVVVGRRVSVARKIAEEAGLDPSAAGSAAFFSRDGIGHTLIAAEIAKRQRAAEAATRAARREAQQASAHQSADPHPAAKPKTAAEHLSELQQLFDSGAITESEYSKRRQEIIDSV
jgi:uncharacterized membrane protein